MIFPLLKTWFRPIFGSALASTRDASKHPTGFRTIGEGGGGSSAGLGRSRKTTRRTDSLSLSESEERLANNVKLQNLETYAGPGAPGSRPSKGIMVSKETMVIEDSVSQNGSHNGDHNTKKIIQESW